LLLYVNITHYIVTKKKSRVFRPTTDRRLEPGRKQSSHRVFCILPFVLYTQGERGGMRSVRDCGSRAVHVVVILFLLPSRWRHREYPAPKMRMRNGFVNMTTFGVSFVQAFFPTGFRTTTNDYEIKTGPVATAWAFFFQCPKTSLPPSPP
jgi:hypothetical protein